MFKICTNKEPNYSKIDNLKLYSEDNAIETSWPEFFYIKLIQNSLKELIVQNKNTGIFACGKIWRILCCKICCTT